MVNEEDVINFLMENKGEATLDEVSLVLKIPKYGLNSAYALLYSLKSKNIVERRNDKWVLTGQKCMPGFSPKPIGETMKTVAKTFREASVSQDRSEISPATADLQVKVELEKRLAPLKSRFVKPDKSFETLKALRSLKSGTILDMLFLRHDGEPLGGIPSSGQFIIVGPVGAGKSLIISEAALKVAESGLRVLYVSFDDFWNVESQRFDLQSRMALKAEALNLNWAKISENMYVMDQRLIDESFTENYKKLIADENITLAMFDSLNGFRSCVGEKNGFHKKLGDIIQTNRICGVTGFFTVHSNLTCLDSRVMPEAEFFPAHLMDGVIAVANVQMSIPGLEIRIRGFERLRVMLVLSCRLCGFMENGVLISITRDGLTRLIEP